MHTSESLHAAYGNALQPSPSTSRRWIEPLPAITRRIALAIRRERKIARAAAELERLSDHLLKDIGIHRCDIGPVVRGDRSLLRHRSDDA